MRRNSPQAYSGGYCGGNALSVVARYLKFFAFCDRDLAWGGDFLTPSVDFLPLSEELLPARLPFLTPSVDFLPLSVDFLAPSVEILPLSEDLLSVTEVIIPPLQEVLARHQKVGTQIVLIHGWNAKARVPKRRTPSCSGTSATGPDFFPQLNRICRMRLPWTIASRFSTRHS